MHMTLLLVKFSVTVDIVFFQEVSTCNEHYIAAPLVKCAILLALIGQFVA